MTGEHRGTLVAMAAVASLLAPMGLGGCDTVDRAQIRSVMWNCIASRGEFERLAKAADDKAQGPSLVARAKVVHDYCEYASLVLEHRETPACTGAMEAYTEIAHGLGAVFSPDGPTPATNLAGALLAADAHLGRCTLQLDESKRPPPP